MLTHPWLRVPRRRPIAALVLLVLATSLLVTWKAPAAHAATSITVNGTGSGRVFDGVGAISGGGGNSRLLFDYPEPQRSQILDYLFKPGYGADLSILKVEIGGDTNSTDGAEPSHMHSATDENYQRGYEWWLMEQAKARNPNIKLAALSWGAPGWIGGGNFWSQDMINYLTKWIQHAQSDHNLTIDYLGGWNERGSNAAWFVNLRSSLNSSGLSSVKLVANDDNGWNAADEMAGNTAFRNAVDIVGSHYTCGYLSDQSTCSSTSTAQGIGKPLWASESGSQDYNTGAAAVARGINRGYIDAKMTAYINWPIVAALYQNLYFSTDGLALADQPWSGAYSVGKTTWALAHTGQFAQPGWRYLDAASGYLGGNRANGSYVVLKSPNNVDYSTVIETLDASSSQTATFAITGGLSTGAVHVWATNMRSGNASDYFVRQSDITPSGGGYTITLQPGYLYSLTTTTGQGKGTATSPARSALALPYTDNFDGYAANRSPRYFTDMNGSFETVPCAAGRAGTCVRQMAPATPIRWTDEPFNAPYTMMGERGWTDYTVSVDALMEQSGAVEVLGRIGQQNRNNNGLDAYHLRLADTGAWSIQRSNSTWGFTTLASGTTAAPGTNQWHNLAFSFQGSTITAKLDGTTLGTANDGTIPAGMAGFGVTGYRTAQYDNYAVTTGSTGTETVSVTNPGAQSSTNGTAVSQQITATDSQGKALTFSATGLPAGLSISSSGLITGTPTTNATSNVTVTASSGTASGQTSFSWTVNPVGSGNLNGTRTVIASGKALDDPGHSTTAGTQLITWSPSGGLNQKWVFTQQADGSYRITNAESNLCVDVSGASGSAGAQILQWTCGNGSNQRWIATPVTGGYTLTSQSSGLLLTTASTADGALITQQANTNSALQHWAIS
ncbi:galactosylceramidase [Longispora fulva]|uniref:galactosylceramidase n=1 Tax=Longispora fulva TaxID=619741 RepID=A0A8J7GP10_9ACTN|nr:RICIN domain-containing protein [Longispora fulva]MBG6134131.1 hypothetical protein [Longispora fulva]GIG62504.1 galactosylceramidase [Longispora fulva]